MCAIGTVSLAVGLVLLQFIPKEWYFAFDGFIICSIAFSYGAAMIVMPFPIRGTAFSTERHSLPV